MPKPPDDLGLTPAVALGLVAGVIAAMCLRQQPAWAQHRAWSRVDVYTDEWITVVSPAARGVAEASEDVDVGATYAVDILSGATQVLTADAISSATHFEEVRHEAHVDVTARLTPSWTFTPSYTASHEKDYDTHALSFGVSTDVLERMATVALTYSVSFERIGMAGDQTFSASALSQTLQMSWAHVLGRMTTLTGVVYGALAQCSDSIGCHSNPYRFVGITSAQGLPEQGSSPAPLLALRERHPDVRARGAAALQLSHGLTDEVALHAGYRLYADGWGIVGHTADLSTAVGLLDERLVLRVEGRGTYQSAASFFRDSYAMGSAVDGPAYRSADRELSASWNAQVGGSIEVNLPGVGPFWTLGLNARASHAWYRYLDFTELPERQAWLVGGGLHAQF